MRYFLFLFLFAIAARAQVVSTTVAVNTNMVLLGRSTNFFSVNSNSFQKAITYLGQNPLQAGVDVSGTSSVLNTLTNMTHVTNLIYLPPGRYLLNSFARMDHLLLQGSGPDTVLVCDPLDSGLRASNTRVDMRNLTIEGTKTNAQYSVAVDQTAVATAWATPTFQEGVAGTDPNGAGADWTHTLSGNVYTLSLASLNTATIRRITSASITLDPNSRYVIDTLTNVVTQYGDMRKLFVYLYDTNGVFVSTFDSKNASTWYNFITGMGSLRFGMALQRFTNSPSSNDTTLMRTDAIRILKLENEAASFSTSGNPDATYGLAGTCTNVYFSNVTFRNMSRTPFILPSCERVVVENCVFENVDQGINITSGKDVVIQNNVFNLNQQVSDGSWVPLKHKRWRGVQSGSCVNLIVANNVILGASWGIEIIPGSRSTVSGNTILAEYLGISLDKGDGNVVNDNTIYLTSYGPYTGIELASTTNATVIGNRVYAPNTALADTFGVAVAGTGVNVRIEKNSFQVPAPIYIPFAILGPTYIEGNDGLYSGTAIWSQSARNRITHNSFKRSGSSAVYGEPSAAVYLWSTDTSGHTVDFNDFDSGNVYCFRGRQAPNVKAYNNVWRMFKAIPAAFIAETVNATDWDIDGQMFQESANVPSSYLTLSDAIGSYNFGQNYHNGRALIMGNRPKQNAVFDVNLAISSAGVDYSTTYDIPFYGLYDVSVVGTLSGDLDNMIAGKYLVGWSPGTASSGWRSTQQLGTTISTEPSAKLTNSTTLFLSAPVTASVTNTSFSFTNVVSVGRITAAISNTLTGAGGTGNFYIQFKKIGNRR